MSTSGMSWQIPTTLFKRPWWDVGIRYLSHLLHSPTVSSSNEGGEIRTNVLLRCSRKGSIGRHGTGIDADDFSTGDLSSRVAADGAITFAHTLANDLTTEGTETLEIKLFGDKNTQ